MYSLSNFSIIVHYAYFALKPQEFLFGHDFLIKKMNRTLSVAI